MILILSDESDISTDNVIKWLIYNGVSHLRLNTSDEIEIISVSINNFLIRKNDIIINSDNITSYWYRKGSINMICDTNDFDYSQFELISHSNIANAINEHIKIESRHLIEYIYIILESKNKIGSKLFSEVNKLKVLDIAQSIGLSVPKTLITNNKERALAYFCDNPNLVTKSISDSFVYFDEVNFMSYTQSLKFEEQNGEDFFLSLIQERIIKLYEIRSFYLKGQFYSMATFSQNNEKTKIDYRNYDIVMPNRSVPYMLPLYVKRKLHIVMKKLFLDTGSIDMIRCTDGKYYFLEINPCGQFGGVSTLCNYYLEELISNYLSSQYE